MWTCPRCGEPNEDTFKECWKCLSDEMTAQVSATPLPPAPPPPELRSLGSVLWRMAVGFVLGMLMGVIVFHREGTPLSQAAVAGAVVGAVLAGVVGVLVWVVFPFKPRPTLPGRDPTELHG